MKKLIFKIQVIALTILLFAACKKDETKIFFLGGNAPVLGANKTNVVLTFATANNEAITFSWTNPDYRFSTGISSHDVRYAIEMDVDPAFTSTSKKAFDSDLAKRLSKTFTVGELNNFLGNTMNLPLDQDVKVYARIVSYVADQQNQVRTGVLYSNVVSFNTTPYPPPPAVDVPDNGDLWVVGDATNMGWDINIPGPYDVDLKFRRISNTLYEGTFNFKGGGGFKLVQQKGNWDTQYRKVSGTWDKGDFRKQNSDPQFDGPPTSGMHTMTVDFQTGLYTMVKI